MTNTLTKNNIRYGYADYFYYLFFGGIWGFGAGGHGSNGGKEEAPEYLTIENMYPLYANGTVAGSYKEDLVYSPHQHYWNSWTNRWGSDTSRHDDYATYKETLYYGSDILGSVRAATDGYARLSGNISYDAFGSPYRRTGSFQNSESLDFGYLGKSYNAATGLYDYGFRDYSPGAARFTTLDPVRDGRNWYAYVLNDPVNFVDLWGLKCESGSDKYYFTLDPDQLVEDQIIKSETGNPLVVLIFDGTTNNKGSSIGRMNIYTKEQFNYNNEINIAKTEPKLSFPIISGSDFIDNDGNHIQNDRIQNGFYKNAYKRKPNSEKLQDEFHGGNPETGSSLPIWDIPNSGDRAIHIGNTTVDVNEGYTEGCPAITSNGDEKVIDNYNKFLIEIGNNNVDVLVQ